LEARYDLLILQKMNTSLLFDVNALLAAKPVFRASTAVAPVSRYQKEFLATLSYTS